MSSTATITSAVEAASLTPPPARTFFYRPELDVVRFFAFLSVFIYHTLNASLDHLVGRHVPMWFAQLQVSISRAGAYGVDLFFVLSAYLITELLIREKETRGSLDVKSFYLRRILRIWPLYYFFVPLAALVPFLNPDHGFTLRYVVGFFFLARNWATIAFGPPYSAALPLWSVSVEEQFYLAWPPVVARLSRRQIALTAVSMIAVANAARVVMLLLHGNGWSVSANTLARLDPMAAGILLAVFLNGRAPNIDSVRRFVLIGGGVVAIAVTGHFAARWGYGLPWLGTLVSYPVVAASATAIVLGSIGIGLRMRPLEYLGKISYGLYVYHQMCIRIVDKYMRVQNGILHVCLREVAALSLTIAISAISYTLLEKPFLKLKEKFAHVNSRPV